ncbi:nucleotidyltransferase family protein [Limimaricola pyoseonensis]|uniref:Molybdenum cofactor cytidylyltransferase n=1 Tax=Limimaricola pyoseonensis TaxID=521013 RepID=A0A1G7KT91_9RHOB|nr:NTP transferase domain-containing protein [Limimaricola pyoseonensis]SDF40316.1 molybdenum cofactor cytidylyltransferase [Limimaricola pyoseonensis]
MAKEMIVGLLLAAGRSRRFGPQDKLRAPFRGRPLVTHAAAALRASGPDRLLAVCADPAVAAVLDGFEIVPTDPEGGQSASLRAGARRARALGAAKLLVVLGDMPRVRPELLREVVAACDAAHPAAAHDGTRIMPPACFPAALLPDLEALEGDRGAAALLRGGAPGAVRLCPAAPGLLIDIDTPEALRAAEADAPHR